MNNSVLSLDLSEPTLLAVLALAGDSRSGNREGTIRSPVMMAPGTLAHVLETSRTCERCSQYLLFICFYVDIPCHFFAVCHKHTN